jgi:hypothetical protein
MESEDMLDLALRYIEQHSLEEFYDEVFLPALLLAEEDRHRGALPELRERFIFQASRDLIDELDREDIAAEQTSAGDESIVVESASQPTAPRVLAVPARDDADEIVALMLCHLLRRRGVPAATQAVTAPLDATVKVLEGHKVEAVVISALPPATVGAARQLCRRLRERSGIPPLVVGVWRHRGNDSDLQDRLRVASVREIVRSLDGAINALSRILPAGAIKPATLPPRPTEKDAGEPHRAPAPAV